jgi:hypothetical protein
MEIGPITVVVIVKVTPGLAATVGAGTYEAYQGIKWTGKLAWCGASYVYNKFTSPSEETIKAEGLAAVKKVVSDKASELLNQVIGEQLGDLKKKIESLAQSATCIVVQSVKINEKIRNITLNIKDKHPKEFSEKLERCFNASCNVINQGGTCVYEFTFKNHSHLTVTFIAMSAAGYLIHEKYGEKIKGIIQQKAPDCHRDAGSKRFAMVPVAYDL